MRQVNKKLALLGAGLAGLMITPMMQVGLSAKDAVQVVNRVSDQRVIKFKTKGGRHVKLKR